MSLMRASTLRSLQSSLRSSGARVTARTARTQFVAKRFASSGSGGHGHEQKSDIPWLIGALVVTPPSCWFLWPEKHDEHHGSHDEHHDDHGKSSEEDQASEDEAAQEESAPAEQADEPEKGAEQHGKEESEGEDDGSDKPSGSEGESQSNPKRSEQEDSQVTKEQSPDKTGDTEDAKFKGPMKPDSAGLADERKSEPRPSKDVRVKRIDSGLGKNLGEGETYDDDDSKKESQATSKPAGDSQGDITQKQKGLSNTDTRHSLPIDQMSDKSTKGSGQPETAKAKGTVDSAGPVTGGPGQN